MAKATKKKPSAPASGETAQSIRAEREAINLRIEADKRLVRELSRRLLEIEGSPVPKTVAATGMTIKPAG